MEVESSDSGITCPKEGHHNSPILTLCCKKDCELSPLNCVFCLLQDHTECNEFMIRVKDIQELNIEQLHNWYDNPIISEIASVTKHVQDGSINQWYDQHTQGIKDQFGQFKKEILHSVDKLEEKMSKAYQTGEDKEKSEQMEEKLGKCSKTFTDLFKIEELNKVLLECESGEKKV